MIYLDPPQDFSPRFEVVSCFCECKGEILLLKRQPLKSEGNKWGAPAGKIDLGETPIQAMKRELREETGQEVAEQELLFRYKVFIRFPDYDFIYYIFSINFNTQEAVTLEPTEHTEKIWVSPQGSLQLSLVRDLDECIKLCFGTSE